MKYLIRDSFVAGILIGIGCVANVMSENSILGAFLFSLALLSICALNYNLFTGKVGYANWKDTFKLIVMLLFNIAGTAFFCWIVANYSNLNIDTSTITNVKLSETWQEALTKGFGCGVLIYIAVRTYRHVNVLNDNAHPLFVIMPVMAFIICGFDHCIANCGYLVMNNIFWTNNLPFWIIGNSVGSLLISKIES